MDAQELLSMSSQKTQALVSSYHVSNGDRQGVLLFTLNHNEGEY